MSDEKLQKVLARAGFGSRREMETWIAQGRVTVNGQPAVLGMRVGESDVLLVDGRPVAAKAAVQGCRVIVYNKPLGEVCTRKDPEGRPTVFDKLPKLVGERWVGIGRLDINTSGLLLFTTDGELANRLMHPSSNVDREYAVRVRGEVTDEMVARLKDGVLLEDGMARFTDVQHFDGSGLNQWYHVVVMEGKNREVRRLWESQGVEVSRLKRVRYGCIFLSRKIAAGCWEELGQKEINDLCDLVGLERRQRSQQTIDEIKSDRRVKRRARPVREVQRRSAVPGRGRKGGR